jgi:hypothetical protein
LRAIVMTGFPDSVILSEADRLQTGRLEKPFTCDCLVDAIRAALAAPPPNAAIEPNAQLDK